MYVIISLCSIALRIWYRHDAPKSKEDLLVKSFKKRKKMLSHFWTKPKDILRFDATTKERYGVLYENELLSLDMDSMSQYEAERRKKEHCRIFYPNNRLRNLYTETILGENALALDEYREQTFEDYCESITSFTKHGIS